MERLSYNLGAGYAVGEEGIFTFSSQGRPYNPRLKKILKVYLLSFI